MWATKEVKNCVIVFNLLRNFPGNKFQLKYFKKGYIVSFIIKFNNNKIPWNRINQIHKDEVIMKLIYFNVGIIINISTIQKNKWKSDWKYSM